jgi:hypothetical protein
LPPTARDLLAKQKAKFEKDVEVVRPRLEGLGEDWRGWYRYYWLIVNTRCFYWVYFRKYADMKRRGKRLGRDECLALVPWGDYFNHEECGVSFLCLFLLRLREQMVKADVGFWGIV